MTTNPPTVLLVGSNSANIEQLRGLTGNTCMIKTATSGEQALAFIDSTPPDFILSDTELPGLDGFGLCRQLRNGNARHIPLILFSQKHDTAEEEKALAAGADDYINLPLSAALLNARIRLHLANARKRNPEGNQTPGQDKTGSRLQLILRLARIAQGKDEKTDMHNIRMGHYSRILGLAAGMAEEQANLLMEAAPLNDIGKIAISDFILKKRGKLTEDEFETIKKHCEIGAEILDDDSSELLRMARVIALTHHEKWNGTGYPNRLKGEGIPLVGRIVAIADVFGALTSKRPYKEAWPVKDAAIMLEASAGEYLDPKLVSLFMGKRSEIVSILEQYPDK